MCRGKKMLLQTCCLIMVSMFKGLMGCIRVQIVLLMQRFHVLYVIGLVWWRSMSASMSVLVLPVRHCCVGTNWHHLVALSVVLCTWMLGTLHVSSTFATHAKFVDTAG